VVYASLYSYSRNIHVLSAFCESWCPTTNTLHTISGEMSISLWDLYRLGRLLIIGKIYDETIPSIQAFEYWISRIWRLSHILANSCLLLLEAEKRCLSPRKASVLKFGLIFGVRRSLSITRQHSVTVIARLPRGYKIMVARFNLKIFVRVVLSWTSSEAWGFPKRRGRAHILPHSYHVSCALLYFLRPGRSSFTRELLRSRA